MTLHFETLEIGDGVPLIGEAILESKDNLSFEGVRLEIRVKEHLKHGGGWSHSAHGAHSAGSTQTIYSEDVPVAEAFKIMNGERREFSLKIAVPAFHSYKDQRKIAYSIKAVAFLKGRPDVTAEVHPIGPRSG